MMKQSKDKKFYEIPSLHMWYSNKLILLINDSKNALND